ncbi:MAG: aminopeptidase [Dehalococcoidia bacterium]|nr:aminopeptidase [Dehalococcoidia bacterium]
MNKIKHPKRIKNIRNYLSEKKLDGIIISNEENRFYFSGLRSSAGFLFITMNDLYLFTDFRYTELASSEAPGWNIQKITSRLGWLPEIIKKLRVSNVGFESEFITVNTFNLIKDTINSSDVEVTLIPTTDIVLTLRAVKDEEEIKLITKAIEIGDKAFEYTEKNIEIGMTEKEVAWIFEKSVREQNAESISFDTIVASGKNAARPHHATGDSKIEANSTIIIDCGAKYNGYCSDLTRTIVIGDAEEKIKNIYDIVHMAQLSAIDLVKVGMTGEECDSIARKIISEAGYGDFFGHSLGHGIGLDVHENPNVGPRSKYIIQNNMPFTVEPGIYLQGWGGVRIEDIVIIIDNKTQVISKAKKINL